jgi:hypothetical protein
MKTIIERLAAPFMVALLAAATAACGGGGRGNNATPGRHPEPNATFPAFVSQIPASARVDSLGFTAPPRTVTAQ